MKKEEKIKEKIRKLLALSESPNENEAKSALLMARRLMYEHKLTKEECVDARKQEIREVLTGWMSGSRRNPWLVPLSAVIGEKYCCKAYRKHIYAKQNSEIGFVGLEDDAATCKEVFEYAVKFVMEQNKRTKAQLKKRSHDAAFIKHCCDSYGLGFIRGLEEAFDEQDIEQEEKGWGLVLSIPKEVTEATKDFGTKKWNCPDRVFSDDYSRGISDGRNFCPEKMLKGSEEIA